ncbi:MAG TPA: tRNA (adenosine(37)-N6)-dimethylallyltransferase MiaA, partial [Anaerolineae bacterium]|nr:tRNA (adenosine(37)-N6)-dimethylallyltransferase MiaA [Anaerolineae bacterium]
MGPGGDGPAPGLPADPARLRPGGPEPLRGQGGGRCEGAGRGRRAAAIRGGSGTSFRCQDGEAVAVSWGKAKGPLIAIVGPTAVGKSELALRLAEEFGGEIVSADSRQIYRGLDIGTAKPTAEERQRVPHHLLDVVNPDEVLTLAQYQELAYAAIDDILARGKVPFLVGGTGLYIKAVVEGWSIPRVPPNERLRAE